MLSYHQLKVELSRLEGVHLGWRSRYLILIFSSNPHDTRWLGQHDTSCKKELSLVLDMTGALDLCAMVAEPCPLGSAEVAGALQAAERFSVRPASGTARALIALEQRCIRRTGPAATYVDQGSLQWQRHTLAGRGLGSGAVHARAAGPALRYRRCANIGQRARPHLRMPRTPRVLRAQASATALRVTAQMLHQRLPTPSVGQHAPEHASRRCAAANVAGHKLSGRSCLMRMEHERCSYLLQWGCRPF